MIRIEHLPADVLDLAPFARDAVSGRLDPNLVLVPRSIETFPAPEDRLDRDAREELAATLERELASLGAHVRVLDAVRALRVPGACAIVTGQQPGFLASPLYSLYKALQAIRLARDLTRRWERPVIPMFWNHADDHDIAEVHHTHVVNANLDLQKIALAGLASGRQPLSRIVFDDVAHRLAPIRAALAQLVDKEPFAQRALELFVPRHGETFARAFTRAFTGLLGASGLVVIEPDWIRGPMSSELARIVGSDPFPLLVRGAKNVIDAGFPVAIEPHGAALLFALDEKGRRALRAGGDGFQYDNESGSRTCAELAAEIVQDPAQWSPGALLRPLVQDLVLPVAGYVGGFGELAYHAELGPLRAHVGAPSTPFIPRVSMTLVDSESRIALAKLETDVASVLRARGAASAAESTTPAPEILVSIRAIGKSAARDLKALEKQLAELDATLPVLVERAAHQLKEVVDALAEKCERVHQNKSGKGKRHERRVNNLLFPREKPQERVLGPLPFVARFGEDWIGELVNEIDPLGSEHLVVHLGEDTARERTSS